MESWAGTKFACLERSVLSQLVEGPLGQEDPRQAGDQASFLRDLRGLEAWHVQWLVPDLCPQVTWGGTRKAGL